MPDEIVEAQPDSPGKRNRMLIIAAVAAVLVLASGVAIGLAVADGGRDDATQTPDTTGTPVATQPTGTPPGARPTQPVPAGSTLATVTTPPENTLAMIDATRLGADAEYRITFGCFGYGPPQGGQTLVIRITTAEPKNESARGFDMNGKNLLALVGPGVAPVKVGGTYKGKLTFRPQGDLLLPVVTEIESAE